MEGAQGLITGEKHVMHTGFPSVTAYVDSAKLKTGRHAIGEKTKCDMSLFLPRELLHATKHLNSYYKIAVLYKHVYVVYVYTNIYIACLEILYLNYRDNLV